MIQKRKIILASQSPRRRILLERLGLSFDVIPSKFEEYFDDSRQAEDVARELGLGKALDVASAHPEAIVIGSDLLIVLDGKQIGKPESEEDARQMLRNFSGRTHQLICSVATVCKTKNYSDVDIALAEVTFEKLPEDMIRQYVATGTTYDKAGGYAIQHPMMRPYIKGLNGRRDTIIGLSCNLVAKQLAKLGMDVASNDILVTDTSLFE